jgi:hypothetical protein
MLCFQSPTAQKFSVSESSSASLNWTSLVSWNSSTMTYSNPAASRTRSSSQRRTNANS